jgi:aryl-alcohol dehydrogenase-like predicted oxidoreductase
MEYVAFGQTNILVSRAALAAESLRLLEAQEQADIIRSAYDAGINYFGLSYNDRGETARHLPVLSGAFMEIRQNILLGLCLNAASPDSLRASLEDSLTALNTDCVDFLHIAGASDSNEEIVGALGKFKKEGKIRFCGLASPFAFPPAQPLMSAIDALQFPFNLYVAENESECEKVLFCAKRDAGCFAAEPLCAPFEYLQEAWTFLNQFEHVVPLWEVKSTEQMGVLMKLVNGVS